MRYALAAGLTAVTFTVLSAKAEIFSYKCRVDGKSQSVKIDDLKNTLKWMGKIYKIKEEESCAKYGWVAELNGASFKFCTATQGYADFLQDGKVIQCNLDR